MTLFSARRVTAAAAAGLAMMFLPAPVQADTVSDFYGGKTVRLIISSTPGGGYDTYARLVARYFGDHVPGRPAIVAQNMPGAGGITAANFMYNQAPKDGSYMGAIQRGVFFEPIFGQYANKAKFDTFKFTWLGSLNRSVSVMMAWAETSPIKTFAEAFDKQAIVGATRSDMETFVLAAQNMLGTKFKIVSGYPGSGDVVLALSRGEVQVHAGSSWAPFRVRFAKELAAGKIIPLVQYALKKHPDLPDVPLITEFARNDEEREILELIYARQTIGRPYIAPPDVPADRAKALQAAFVAMTEAPDFLAQARKSRLEINVVPADEVIALLKNVAGASPEILAKTKAAVSDTRTVTLAELKTVPVTIAKLGKKGRVQFTGADGKTLRGRLTGRTKITIAGKKAKTDSLKDGLACKVAWMGNGGRVVKLDCD